jgi:arabinogalactan endo-1,4-beta-galactosidase
VIEIRLSKLVPYDVYAQSFYPYLDIITDALPNVTLFDIESRTVLLTFTIVEINCRKKGSTNTLTFFRAMHNSGYQEEGQ